MSSKIYHVIFCNPFGEICPVSSFMEHLKPRSIAKVLHYLNLLQEKGPTLPRPYADFLHDGIHEMRIKVKGENVRLLYFFCYETYIIMYSAFSKNTDRVPEKYVREISNFRDKFIKTIKPEKLKESLNAL